MLDQLDIKNFVLINHLCIDFTSNFSVISGETGAGKSIILSAISIILGEKCKSDIIRKGESEAVLTGVFSYSEKADAIKEFLEKEDLLGEDDTIIITRTIKENGRTINKINSKTVTRDIVSALGSLLIDISSQRAHQGLLKSDVQLKLLDKFAKCDSLLSEYKERYSEYVIASKELEELKERSEKAKRDYDYYQFCLSELEKADLKEGEDDILSAELKRISLSEALTEEVSSAQGLLRGDISEGALSLLSHSVQALKKASSRDSSLDELCSRLESCQIEAEDISESLRDYLSALTFSESELEEKNARLSQLQRIKKKYGPSISDAIKKREEYKLFINSADNAEELIVESEKVLARKKELLNTASINLSLKRKNEAKDLESKILTVLKKLSMDGAEFKVSFEEINPSSEGCDKVEFLIRANKGEKMGAIKDVASGGELSRILLSLKAVLAKEDETETLVFDEVDSGIGGLVSANVGDVILALSKDHQVIAITHSAQIAAKANEHYLVYKKEEGGRTLSHLKKIEKDERVKEIARLLSGKASESALNHARELIEV